MANLERYFENPAVWHAERYLENPEEVLRFEATARLVPTSVSNLLDVGAGNGAFLSFLEKMRPEMRPLGIEPSQSAIDNKLCISELRRGSMAELPFGDQSFGAVSALEVIEHLPVGIFEKGLAELERVAERFILISVPHCEARVNVVCPLCACEFNPSTHVRSFDASKLASLFRQFRLAQLTELGEKQEFILPGLRNEFRRIFARGVFPAEVVCPQCGFCKDGLAVPPSGVRTGRPSLIKQLFFKKKPRWFLALYERNA